LKGNIALHLDLIPIFHNTSVSSNQGRDYTNVDLHQMLDFDQRYSEQTLRKRCHVIEVHTWSDPLIGNACGQPDELCNLLELEIKEKKK